MRQAEGSTQKAGGRKSVPQSDGSWASRKPQAGLVHPRLPPGQDCQTGVAAYCLLPAAYGVRRATGQ